MNCKNCGKPIEQGPPTPDVYWWHLKGATVWCDPAQYTPRWRHNPETAGKRAEPA